MKKDQSVLGWQLRRSLFSSPSAKFLPLTRRHFCLSTRPFWCDFVCVRFRACSHFHGSYAMPRFHLHGFFTRKKVNIHFREHFRRCKFPECALRFYFLTSDGARFSHEKKGSGLLRKKNSSGVLLVLWLQWQCDLGLVPPGQVCESSVQSVWGWGKVVQRSATIVPFQVRQSGWGTHLTATALHCTTQGGG